MPNNKPSFSIVIATWNSKNYILRLLKSVLGQSLPFSQIIIIDNSSSDETVKLIRENFNGIAIIENRRNLGFSKAYNQGIKLSKTDYVLVCNQDIILDKNFNEILAKEAASDPSIASLGGKVMKFVLDDNQEDGVKLLNFIDTTGLVAKRSREFSDRGQDEPDSGRYEERQEVFGISGALVLYKKQALEEAKIFDEYFDEDFFAYKEDIDLAWRLRLLGYKSVYQPSALAWHARSLSLEQKTGRFFSFKKIKIQLKRDKFLNFLSFRNQLLLITKNEFSVSIFLALPFILFAILRNSIFYLLFQPTTFFKSLANYFKLRPKIRQKTRALAPKIKLKSPDVRKLLMLDKKP